eukprot:1506463-Rhodomonas_salina.5
MRGHAWRIWRIWRMCGVALYGGCGVTGAYGRMGRMCGQEHRQARGSASTKPSSALDGPFSDSADACTGVAQVLGLIFAVCHCDKYRSGLAPYPSTYLLSVAAYPSTIP